MILSTLCLVLGVASAPPEDAPAPVASTAHRSRLAVLGLTAEGDKQVAATFIDVLVTAVAETGLYDVISKNEIDSMLGLEKAKDVLGCTEAACIAEIGGALGVERLISGSVAKLGGAYVVNLQLINVAYGNVENRVSMPWEGAELLIVQVIRAAAQQLILPAKDKKPGAVELTQVPQGAAVFVDNKPATARTAELAIGPHVAKITADGFQDKTLHFVVKNGEVVSLDGALEKVVARTDAAKKVTVAVDPEVTLYTDIGSFGDGKALGLALEGSYRFSQWLRVGLRVPIRIVNNDTVYESEPWPTTTLVPKGLSAGIFVATSPLFREGTYDLSIDTGIYMRNAGLEVVSFTLPRQYSVGPNAGKSYGHNGDFILEWQSGASISYYLSSAFVIGLGLRYCFTPQIKIEHNGETVARSLRSIVIAPRFAVLF